MHFLFPPPPPPHLMPWFLTAALALAVGLLVMRRGVPQLIADVRGLFPAFAFRRGPGFADRFQSRALSPRSNVAFEEYRQTTLDKLEGEAQEFRKFLDGLRHSADAADFQAFLQSRREVKALR